VIIFFTLSPFADTVWKYVVTCHSNNFLINGRDRYVGLIIAAIPEKDNYEEIIIQLIG